MFQSLHTYLSTLPAGLDSHPDYWAKGSLMRGLVMHPALKASCSELPPELRAFVESPPAPSAWVRETHQAALTMALADRIGAPAVLEFVRADMMQTLASPLYRMLFVLVGPRRVMNAASSRFQHFHRGLELRCEVDDDGGRLVIEPPPSLLTPLVADCFAASFVVVAQLAGAQGAACDVEFRASGDVEYRLRWR
jgi:hypothetical protein